MTHTTEVLKLISAYNENPTDEGIAKIIDGMTEITKSLQSQNAELLEALKRLTGCLDTNQKGSLDTLNNAYLQAKEAIKKAEGK